MDVHAPWTCDECGQPIVHAEDGYVEWLKRLNNGDEPFVASCRQIRLVHHRLSSPDRDTKNACYLDEDHYFARDKSTISSLPLPELLSADGLTRLLEMLADRRFANQGELIEMVQRLHTPGYEQARPHAESAIREGVISPNLAPGFFWQEQIEEVIVWAEEHQQGSL